MDRMAKFIPEEIWALWQRRLDEVKSGGAGFVLRRATNNKNRPVGLICLLVDGKALPIARMIEPFDTRRYTVGEQH